MSKPDPKNLVIAATRGPIAAAQMIAAWRELPEERQTEHTMDAMIAVSKRLQNAHVVNDDPYNTTPSAYTVVTADEPDCDGQFYTVTTVQACNAPMADVLAEELAMNVCIAVYAGDHVDWARMAWSGEKAPWYDDDTVGTAWDNTRD